MSKFDIIVELMVKNGVTTKFSKNLFKNLVNDEPIIELDFTEHDKPFEDRIKSLQDENRKLYNQIMKTEKDYQEEVKVLYQRIAELESKETEKLKKYTTVIVAKEINGQTYVTLDDFMSVVNDLQAEIGT